MRQLSREQGTRSANSRRSIPARPGPRPRTQYASKRSPRGRECRGGLAPDPQREPTGAVRQCPTEKRGHGLVSNIADPKYPQKRFQYWKIEGEGAGTHEHKILLIVQWIPAEPLQSVSDGAPAEITPGTPGVEIATVRVEVPLRWERESRNRFRRAFSHGKTMDAGTTLTPHCFEGTGGDGLHGRFRLTQ